MDDQMIFKRYEIKYLISKAQQEMIQRNMDEYMTGDAYGRSTICNIYFDTPDFLMVRRSLEGPLYKEKLRLRSYGAAGPDSRVFLEIKKKYESVVYKRRVGMTLAEAVRYLNGGEPAQRSQITNEIDYLFRLYDPLRPAAWISYEREAFYAKDDHDLRITFDGNILWRDERLNLNSAIYGTPILGRDQILMEVKTGTSIPLWLTELLTVNRIYKTSFSKYGMAYRGMKTRELAGGINCA